MSDAPLQARQGSVVLGASERHESDTGAVVEPLLLVTLNEPRIGQIMCVDGLRYRVVRILLWTGTVARLEIERTADDD